MDTTVLSTQDTDLNKKNKIPALLGAYILGYGQA